MYHENSRQPCCSRFPVSKAEGKKPRLVKKQGLCHPVPSRLLRRVNAKANGTYGSRWGELVGWLVDWLVGGVRRRERESIHRESLACGLVVHRKSGRRRRYQLRLMTHHQPRTAQAKPYFPCAKTATDGPGRIIAVLRPHCVSAEMGFSPDMYPHLRDRALLPSIRRNSTTDIMDMDHVLPGRQGLAVTFPSPPRPPRHQKLKPSLWMGR
jgi:hypothetical protein